MTTTELMTTLETLEDAMAISYFVDDDGNVRLTYFEDCEELFEQADSFEMVEFYEVYRFGSVEVWATSEAYDD